MKSGSKVIILAAMLGGLYFAYRRGYLPNLFGTAKTPVVTPGTGQTHLPVTPSNGQDAGMNQWEQALWNNSAVVSNWAKSNRKWVAAMMKIESGTLGASAKSSKGALGLLQVMPATAKMMFKAGYTHFPATVATLTTEAGGIYFGTAYLEHLSRIKSNRDWITKAYYGGEGFESKGAGYVASCETYLGQIKTAYADLYEGETA